MAARTPEALAAELLAAAAAGVAATRAVVAKGALNVKNDWKANVQRSAPTHNAYAHNAVTFDTKIAGLYVEAEIGYDKDKRGGDLGNLLEYGAPGKSPGHRDGGRALDAEEPRFVKALEDMVEKPWR